MRGMDVDSTQTLETWVDHRSGIHLNMYDRDHDGM